MYYSNSYLKYVKVLLSDITFSIKVCFLHVVYFVNEIIHFRPPSTYGTNSSIPRPDPVNPPTVPSNSTTMIPNDQEDKIGGDGYGSSKMRASNWRLMGLGMHNLQVLILIQSYFF